VSLRVAILALLVGLLLSTVAGIGGVAVLSTRQAIGELEAKHFELVSTAATGEVKNLLEPAHSLLAEFRTQADRGLLPVDDPDRLAELLVERLRYRENLAWLSYSDDATGRFVGAWRRPDGAIVLNRSSPDVDGGRPFEEVVDADGTRSPIRRDVKPGYDPRQRPWYRAAAATDGVVWTEPFEFNEGKMGITAALALREVGTPRVRGVFTADFFLEDVSRFLADLVGGHHRHAFVLARNGDVIASSSTAEGDGSDRILPAALRAMPGSLATLEVGSPLSFTFGHVGVRYAAVFQVFRVAGGLEWVSGVVAREDAFLAVVYDNAWFAGTVGLLLLALAVALGSVLAYRFSAPLGTIASDLERVGRFEISHQPAPTSFVKEIGVVSDAVERMKTGLSSFGHYVPAKLVRELVSSGNEARLGGQIRTLTIHFSDIDGFTSISEQMEPSPLVRHLAEYLQEMTTVLEEEEGTVGKFLGDGILAFFNAPNDVRDHATRACRAALREEERLRGLQARWEAEGRPILRARIGLHTGEALVGNIGTPDRFEYTVAGDAVNLASRLEGLNKVYGTRILASQALREAAGPGFEWRSLDRVAVAGRAGGTLVSELLGERGHVAPESLRARDLYERALGAYVQRRFAEAAAGFRAAADALPGNRAAETMLRRTELLQREPPPPSWDGTHLQTSK
jgi:adenylate cyclase